MTIRHVDSSEGERQSKMAANSKSHVISQTAYAGANGNFYALCWYALTISQFTVNKSAYILGMEWRLLCGQLQVKIASNVQIQDQTHYVVQSQIVLDPSTCKEKRNEYTIIHLMLGLENKILFYCHLIIFRWK